MSRPIMFPESFGDVPWVSEILCNEATGKRRRATASSARSDAMFFGWLWGAWGIFLAVPLLAVIKTVCERIPPWSRVAEFLAE